ncbi:MAG: glycerophosphodiester phosphodiesterase [Ruminococcaceae bacterium]|nr:glycerophosphodiester phosphodiesterase [Oscillospiraceae bacterium]
MKLKNKIVLTVGAVGAAVASFLAFADDVYLGTVELPESFTLTAHTGCSGTKDNSLDAITLGFGYGADIVEFDLFFDKNGKAVMSHDEPAGNVFTVEQAFELISGYKGLRVNVDVKRTDDLKQVVLLAQKYGIADRIFYTGITEDTVEAVKEQTPEILYYLNTDIDSSRKEDDAYINELIEKVSSLGAAGLNIHHSGCSEKMVELFHKSGLQVSVWTVNKKKDMYKALSMKCDNITTRHPEVLKELIDKTKNR